jgi:hypothetical protein
VRPGPPGPRLATGPCRRGHGRHAAENQPAPSRENPDRETIERGTEEEKDKKRRRIGNPDVEPRPKAMNENEQEIIKQIVARFKSKK